MAFNFPSSPSNGDTYTANGFTYEWDGSKWIRKSPSTGAQGSTGPTGAQGAAGAQGATAAVGAQGAAGAQGATGASGSATLSNNADNRVITGGSGTNLNGESNLTFDGSTLGVNGNLSIADKIIHTGDTNCFISFPADDQIVFEGGGHERFRINGTTGKYLFGRDITGRSANYNNTGVVPTIQIEDDTEASFSVAKFSNNTDSSRIYLQKGRGSTGSAAVVQDNDTLGMIVFNGYNGSGFRNAAQITAEVDGTPTSSGDDTDMPGALVFKTSADGTNVPAEALRIDSSGRLLLGHTTSQTIGGNAHPLVQLNVNSNQQVLSLARFENVPAGPSIQLGKSRASSAGNYTVVQDGDGLGNITFSGADGTDLISRGAVIEAQVDGTPGSNDMPGRLVFMTTSDGSDSPTERLRITSGGKVGIGSEIPSRIMTIVDTPGGGIGVIGTNAGIYLGTNHTGGFQNNAAIARAAAINYHITGAAAGDLCIASESAQSMIFGLSHSAGAIDQAIHISRLREFNFYYGSQNFKISTGNHSSSSERIRIDSSGRLIVGSGSHGGGTQVVIKGGGVNTYSTLGMYSNHTNPAADTLLSQIRFGSNATADGADIRAHADADWGTNDYPTRIGFYLAPDGSNSRHERFRISSNGNVTIDDGNLIVASGHGIDFSATGGPTNSSGSASGSSELLDDYEIGTFSPFYTDNQNTQFSQHTSGYSYGEYTKIGKLVYFTCGVRCSGYDRTPVGRIFLEGLPFVSKNYGDDDEPVFAMQSRLWGSGTPPTLARMQQGTGGTGRTRISLGKLQHTATNETQLDGSNFDTSATCRVLISGHYMVP